MKVGIGYPPLKGPKGNPLLAQNRQFQWVSISSYMYPMVPAYAASLLKEAGHDVLWMDGIAESQEYEEWVKDVCDSNLDLLVMETKTPVVKRHWKIVDELKQMNPDMRIALVGDHVTALPEESMQNCRVDYVFTGGDYDFLTLNIANHLQNREKINSGIWFRRDGKIKNTGRFQLHSLEKLPLLDRDLTKWWLYSANVGNYRQTPGTYTMAGRDCWHHECRFCSWTLMYPEYRVRKPESLLNEIEILVDKYGIKEIMDDTGTFPIGSWLKGFCKGMVERGLNKEVVLDCNMRFGALTYDEFKMMARAGFRFLLFGLESANLYTLNKLHKKITPKDIIETCKDASKAGLAPHIAIMFGFPWETKEDARRTLDLGSYLLKKGYAKTMQATLTMPYPGTPLFEEAKRNNWLKTMDWDCYDMTEPVMYTQIKEDELVAMVEKMYSVAFHPEFILRTFLSIRRIEDFNYFYRSAKKLIGHVMDYANRSKRVE